MDLGIKGRKAIVCAASKGLGKGCAMALAHEGVDLVINARTKVELDATARGHCNGIDRPPRMLSEFHDSKPGDARDFWNIGCHRYIVAILQRLEHLRKCGRPTFVVKAAIVRAGAADGSDIKPLCGPCVDLPIPVARDQHFCSVSRIVTLLDEWRHEMLAVPHRENRRNFDFVVNVRGLDRHAGGAPHESKIPGRHDPGSLVKGRRGDNVPSERSHRHSTYRPVCGSGIE